MTGAEKSRNGCYVKCCGRPSFPEWSLYDCGAQLARIQKTQDVEIRPSSSKIKWGRNEIGPMTTPASRDMPKRSSRISGHRCARLLSIPASGRVGGDAGFSETRVMVQGSSKWTHQCPFYITIYYIHGTGYSANVVKYNSTTHTWRIFIKILTIDF